MAWSLTADTFRASKTADGRVASCLGIALYSPSATEQRRDEAFSRRASCSGTVLPDRLTTACAAEASTSAPRKSKFVQSTLERREAERIARTPQGDSRGPEGHTMHEASTSGSGGRSRSRERSQAYREQNSGSQRFRPAPQTAGTSPADGRRRHKSTSRGIGSPADGDYKAREGDPVKRHAATRDRMPAGQPRSSAKQPTATFFTSETFEEAGANAEMIEALAAFGITRPSHIQAAALKAANSHSRHLLVADHAGSGKTLAYLVPLVQQLRAREAAEGQRIAAPGRPVILIVLPTNELSAQVLKVIRSIAQGGARLRAIGITGGFHKRDQRRQLAETADVVVGTPGRLGELCKMGHLGLDKCQAVVLDEADVLLGQASMFEEQMDVLRDAVLPSTRYVLVTASLPEATWMHLQGEFPGLDAVLGPGLHRPAPGSLEQLIDCSGGDIVNEETGYARKAAALLKVLKEQAAARTVVFCNKLETCRKVENTLTRSMNGDVSTVLPYHTAIEEARRRINLEEFLREPDAGRSAVLVCTDRTSRGIDTAGVGHVVMFDFPRDPSEYVRRAGRTARGAGGRGVVSLLVLGRQVRLARQILERNDKGLPLHRVPVA